MRLSQKRGFSGTFVWWQWVVTHVDTDGWPFGVFLAHDCRPAGWAELVSCVSMVF